MNKVIGIFKDSAKEFKSISALTVTAMLIAVSYILESRTIFIGDMKINFAFIAIAIIGMLYGPTISFFAGGICDIVGFLAAPKWGFLPLYTLIAMFQGLIYGLILYKKSGKKLAVSIVIARLIDVLLINMVINTYANIHYGFIASQSISTIIATRALKNGLELILDIPLMLAVLPTVLLAYNQSRGRSSRNVT